MMSIDRRRRQTLVKVLTHTNALFKTEGTVRAVKSGKLVSTDWVSSSFRRFVTKVHTPDPRNA